MIAFVDTTTIGDLTLTNPVSQDLLDGAPAQGNTTGNTTVLELPALGDDAKLVEALQEVKQLIPAILEERLIEAGRRLHV